MNEEELNGWENFKNSFKAIKWYEWILFGIMIIGVLIQHGTQCFSAINVGYSMGIYEFFKEFGDISTILLTFGLILCAKASSSCFVFFILSSINSLTHTMFFYKSTREATIELLLYHLITIVLCIIAWIIWNKHRDDERKEIVKVRTLPEIFSIITMGVLIVLIGALIVFGANDYLSICLYVLYAIALILQILRYKERFLFSAIIYAATFVSNVIFFIQKMALIVENDIKDFTWQYEALMITRALILLIIALLGIYNLAKLQKERNVNNE